MDALIKIPSSEFNEDVFNKIKALIKSFGNAEITIAVSNQAEGLFRNESKQEYWDRLDRSVADIKNASGITFTMEELGEYVRKTNDQ